MLGAAFLSSYPQAARTSWTLTPTPPLCARAHTRRSLRAQGRAATLAVLFHEVPHEIGDVAILMQARAPHATSRRASSSPPPAEAHPPRARPQAGFGKWRAIRAQLGTALAALLGAVVALVTGESQAGQPLELPRLLFPHMPTVALI